MLHRQGDGRPEVRRPTWPRWPDDIPDNGGAGAAVGVSMGRVGNPGVMMWWSKRSGERPRVRVLWWPLALSLAVSVGLTVLLNMAR